MPATRTGHDRLRTWLSVQRQAEPHRWYRTREVATLWRLGESTAARVLAQWHARGLLERRRERKFFLWRWRETSSDPPNTLQSAE